MGVFGSIADFLGLSNNYDPTADVNANTMYTGTVKGAMASQADVGGQQGALAQLLLQQAMGGGPNLAQQQMQMNQESNARGMASAAGSARGINPGLAARMALEGGAAANSQAAGQSAMLRMQQQLAAQGQAGDVLSQQRAGDISAGTGFGGLENQRNLEIARLKYGAANQRAGAAGGLFGGLMSGLGAGLGYGVDQGWFGSRDANIMAAHGAEVPGKAKVEGDSPKNDTVDAKVSPGEIILPRSVTQAEDAPEKAAAFVRAIRRKKEAAEGPGPKGYARVLHKTREIRAQLDHIEKMCRGGEA